MTGTAPIGIFDSGYGGLTVFQKIREALPQYDFIYLGDNARAPYGTRPFETVYTFTKQAVFRLFEMGCPLVILACNTASAKALRTIQQTDLPHGNNPTRRVLGVIRPTVEVLDGISRSKHVGILGTPGTIASESYSLEIAKIFPHIRVSAEACPEWVSLVENREINTPKADELIRENIDALFSRDPEIDTLVLGCTHYPLLMEKISKYVPENVSVFSQGERVASALSDYLRRHPEMERRLSKNGYIRFLTTESAERFSENASFFLGKTIPAERTII